MPYSLGQRYGTRKDRQGVRLKPILLIMTRAPQIGAAKRRLASDIGYTAAWRFHRNTLKQVSTKLTRHPQWKVQMLVSPQRAARASRNWPIRGQPHAQGQGDLGRRMLRGLSGFPRGVPVIVIGSDIPGVTPSIIRKAFSALRNRDAVFGPAQDGGYWLAGFSGRRNFWRPFHKVQWSTDQALADTLANFSHRQLALVDTLSDVDDGCAFRAHTTSL